MRAWITRNRETLIPVLLVAICVFAIANVIKHKILTPSALATNKDALAALNSCVNVIFVTLGAVFSYYRFFRGRTFFSRAELALEVAVIAATPEKNLHALSLAVKNIGSLAIWEPVPEIHIYRHGPDDPKREVWDAWQEARSTHADPNALSVIESGETSSFINGHLVDKAVWAITYVAFVRSRNRDIWKCSKTVSNLLKEKNDAPDQGA
jgi:hypothetical protein